MALHSFMRVGEVSKRAARVKNNIRRKKGTRAIIFRSARRSSCWVGKGRRRWRYRSGLQLMALAKGGREGECAHAKTHKTHTHTHTHT